MNAGDAQVFLDSTVEIDVTKKTIRLSKILGWWDDIESCFLC